MNIAFFGASQLGYICCKSIIEMGSDVVAIFTIPEKFTIKYKNKNKEVVTNSLYKDFSTFNKKYKIPVYEINGDLNSYYDEFNKLNVDLIICIGWYYNIPNKFMRSLTKGAIGIHASLLPKYRGNAPLVWAMINGEKETGISLFYFNEIVDGGDIIDQKKIQILDNDYISDILHKVEIASVEILQKNIPLIEVGKENKIPQNHNLATVFPKRSPENGLIDWTKNSKEINNFIRAQSKPYPGAFTVLNGKKAIIWEAEIKTME